VAGLEGLALDDFFEESYKQLLLRSPEALTSLGLAESYGLRNDQLDDLSDAYIRETQKLEVAILDLLRSYDRKALPPEQRVSYDVYEWSLDTQVRGHQFMYHEYPLHHSIGSYHFNLDGLFSETHPLKTRQDVEDYISRLSQVLRQTEQVMDGLGIREKMGIIPPKFIIQLARNDILDYLGIHSPDLTSVKGASLIMYTRLDVALDEIKGQSEADKQGFREAALKAIETSVIPAYGLMLDYLDRVEPLATDDAGVWKLPDGDDYYAFMLRQETSTDLTPEEIHAIGLAEVERIHQEMRDTLVAMGYPEDAPLSELMQQAVDDFGYYDISTSNGQEEYVSEIERVIEEADRRAADVFDLKPGYGVVVIPGEYGGYYSPGAPDGSRPGSYHVSLRGRWQPKYGLYTIVYHETIPGHHYQIATAQGLDLPSFRNHTIFNAYAEGWALYSERLAWELGVYDDNPYGNLGRLQYELLRAVRLVTDTGIHALGWTRQEAKSYMDEAISPPWFSYEVDRYVVLPAQAIGYKIGMIKILELRQRAMDQLGDQFDLKEFHNVVLGNGSLPLEILEHVVQDYVDAKSAASPAETGYVPVFEPGGCRFNVPSGYNVECGDLIVPEDRSRPDGPMIRLHVAVFKSASSNPAPDPVILLEGGPGGNLLDRSARFMQLGGDEILKTRDYILFNQRGTHYAQPSLECPGQEDFYWGLAEQELSHTERNAKKIEFLVDCQKALLAQGINLAAYSSAENAADVNDLRVALGYERVNLYGGSYGTRLALTIMRDHPDGIRSAIIDSVLPPQVDLDVELASSADRAFTTLFEGCAANAQCTARYPDLGETFYQLVDELNVNPVTVKLRGNEVAAWVDGDIFMDAVFGCLYRSDVIPWIPSLIHEVRRGNYDVLIAPLEVMFDESAISLGMYHSVQCREEVAFESHEAALSRGAGLPPQVVQHFASSFAFTLCESWQSGQAALIENKPVVSDIPTLVLTGQYDPITPPAWGQLATETLSNSFYYEFPGFGHGVSFDGPCGVKMLLEFLSDPRKEPDSSCIDELTGPDFR
jgi:uncharacterized protein (DUF885 family)/pimeloyl-ACP methyl ester carboxylesterase